MTKPLRLTCRSGTALVLLVSLMAVILGFVGIAIYIGLDAYAQNELQKAASTAALAGASSFFDGDPTSPAANTGIPIYSAAAGTNAVLADFSKIIQASPSLKNMNARLTSLPQISNQQIGLTVEADIPTPLLAPLNLKSWQVNAEAYARYVKLELDSPVTLDPAGGILMQTVSLPAPLVDGPGSDLHIVSSQPYHGYVVEACSGNQCYDIGGGALLDGPGMVVNQTFGTDPTPHRVLYGSVYIDLAATLLEAGSSNYQGFVKKASKIKIISNGLYDEYNSLTDRRAIDLVPGKTILSKIEIYHFATTCSGLDQCVIPPGFQPG